MIPVRAPAEHYRSPIVRFGLRLFAVLLIVVGVVAVVPLARSIRDARASTVWPTVTGKVSESGVEERTAPGGRRSYRPRVWYNYAVDGRGYSHSAISFQDLGGPDRGAAEAVVAKYPADSAVTVWYDPVDPQNAVLEPGAPPRVYIVALVSPGMILIGILLWRWTRRTPAESTRAAGPGEGAEPTDTGQRDAADGRAGRASSG